MRFAPKNSPYPHCVEKGEKTAIWGVKNPLSHAMERGFRGGAKFPN